MIIVYTQLFVWRKTYLEENRCETSYANCMRNGTGIDAFIYSALHIFGSRYTKIAFYLFHATLAFSFTVVGYICFHRYNTS